MPAVSVSSSSTVAPGTCPARVAASASYSVLYEEFGLTDEAVVAAAKESIEAAASGTAAPAGAGVSRGGVFTSTATGDH